MSVETRAQCSPALTASTGQGCIEQDSLDIAAHDQLADRAPPTQADDEEVGTGVVGCGDELLGGVPAASESPDVVPHARLLQLPSYVGQLFRCQRLVYQRLPCRGVDNDRHDQPVRLSVNSSSSLGEKGSLSPDHRSWW